jgi:hypothetical protein
MRERESDGRRRRAARERRGHRGVQGQLQESFSASKRQAGGGIGGLLGASTHLLLEEDNPQLQIAPWFWGVSQRSSKQSKFCMF